MFICSNGGIHSFTDECRGDIIIPEICQSDNTIITSIGKNAGENLPITSINMSQTQITTIKQYAFVYCYQLVSVILPPTITTLSNNAFGVTKIKSIFLPKTVSSINDGPFNQCTELNSIEVEEGNSNFISENNCIFSPDYHILYRACSNITFSFLKKYLDKITILEQYCFSGTFLERFIANDLITNITKYSFHGCNSLTYCDLSKSKIELIDYKTVWAIPVTILILPSSLTTIKSLAINSLRKLKVLTLPSSITTIEEGSIVGCTALEYLFYYSLVPLSEKIFFTDTLEIETNKKLKIIVSPDFPETTIGTIPIYSKDAHNAYYYRKTKLCTFKKMLKFQPSQIFSIISFTNIHNNISN